MIMKMIKMIMMAMLLLMINIIINNRTSTWKYPSKLTYDYFQNYICRTIMRRNHRAHNTMLSASCIYKFQTDSEPQHAPTMISTPTLH